MISSLTVSLWPHTTQSRGEIRSSSLRQKLIGFIVYFLYIDVIYIQTLTDDIEAKTTSEGEANEFLVQFIVTLDLDALPLLFQQIP